ncbi:L-2-hydroxyglutarate oxidase [Lutibacter sp. TH_r2]|uniref:L-2-hydroxyglutarate oxidase n=1 Tax=Lutibacter sp. TH_r2 TaxID=3082083 RepID=UPI002953E1B7|nr:L-2-hydroxyglutarate oxidase [Lutibacter sp. TH_r2]MDV7188239.1 L-2-hydroxyglutarate oxidase [Lutibacter sp. TH_r2]
MSNKSDYIVVGGGVVGLATAYKLQEKFPNKTITILEKEAEVGMHQTGRNSGVMHSGIYYKPGSYKAKNCRNGHAQLVKFSKQNNVNFDVCGKIIVATSNEEIPGLENIFQRGLKNKTEGICYLTSEELKEKEPFIKGVKAIYVPTAGIIDYVGLCKTFVEKVRAINLKSQFIPNCEVNEVISEKNNSILKTSIGDFSAEKVVFCTGLQSDRVAEKDNLELDMHIVGFRGDYYELTAEAKHKIKNLVYPVPDPKFPFLGVHFTRMVDGSIECGPNAVFTFKREGYNKTSFSLKDTYEALKFKGTWKLFGKHWRKGIGEYKRAFSKRLFIKELQKLMPSITVNDVKVARSGVRAQAIDYGGNMVDDFKIMKHNGNIHVINAPSPAATACLAIADEIIKVVVE